MSNQNGKNRVFHTACSGHSTKNTPNASAINSITSVDRRRYQPAATIAAPARIHIHHGSHSVGGITLPFTSRLRATPRTMPAIAFFTGLGKKIQYGTLNELPVENTLA